MGSSVGNMFEDEDDESDAMSRIQVNDDVKTKDIFEKYLGLYPSKFHTFLVIHQLLVFFM